MLNPSASLGVTSLPQPGLPNYDGTPATRSQMVRTDGEGCVLFFGKDGVLYDHDGYLIPDATGTVCTQCMVPGVMEMISVPVPGHCNLYYVFTALGNEEVVEACNPEWPTLLEVAILDLSVNNPLYPDRKGALMDINYGQEPIPGVNIAISEISNEYVGQLDHSRKACTNSPMIRVIDPTGSGELFFLYFIGRAAVVEYRIDAAGISLVTTDMDQVDFQPTMETWGAYVDKPYYRDAAITRTNGNEIRIAMTDDYLQGYDVGTDDYSTGHGPILILRYNGTTGALLGTEEIPFGTDGMPDFGSDLGAPPPNPGTGLTGGPGGIAWLDAGNTLLIQGEARVGNQWEYHIGTFDLINDDWTDLTSTLNVQVPEDFMYARLSTSRMNVNSPAYYLPHAGGLARIEDPLGVPTWNAAVGVSTALAPPEYAGYPGDPYFHPRFLNAQVTRDDAHLAAYQNTGCCDMWLNYLSYPGYDFGTETATLHWYPYDNPFGNCGEVNFSADLVVPPWINLYIHDMTLKFGLDARLILQAGAYVKAEHSNFLPVDCEVRWPGIRVEGNPANATQNEADQGSLWLDNSMVEKAHVGVWCARDDGSGNAVDGHFGGIVRGYGSTFRNCIVGTRIEQYHRIIGTEQDNKSVFNNTRFETTTFWPDFGFNLPKTHMHLYDVNGVNVIRCAFINIATLDQCPPENRGVGILSLDASYRCKGFGNFTDNRFERLHVGILNSWNDPLFANSVDGMHFDRNLVGIYDMACTYSIVKNNRFTAMTSTTVIDDYLTMGMYIDQSAGYLVERNYFQDIDDTEPQEVRSVGIWFHGDQPAENRIYDNEFHDLTIGNVAEGVHHGDVNGTKTGLQWLCGLYEGEDYDQLLLWPNGTIKLQQGGLTLNSTAGNVFQSSNQTCQGPPFEPAVFADHDGILIVYNYYNNGGSPDSRPECVEVTDGGPSITATGDFYDLDAVDADVPFNANDHCGNGLLDKSNDGVLVHKSAYESKQNQLLSAVLAYKGQLDNGEKEDVLEAIDADPAWPSHQLRGFLLAKSPLSEEAIIAAINRTAPMDPWHLTQVLIANSRLSATIWAELDNSGVLSPFFYNMVLEHEADPSYREALQEEIDLRSVEKDLERRLLVRALYEDSTYTGKVDTLRALFTHDTLGHGPQVAYQLALSHQRAADITALDAMLALDPRYDRLRNLGDLQVALGHDWQSASTADIAALASIAGSGERMGRAAGWGVLYAIGGTDSLPNGTLPFPYRSATAGQETSVKGPKALLMAYPDPAQDRLMITNPSDAIGTLEVLDAQGRVAAKTSVANQIGFVELDVRSWAPGLYLARMMSEAGIVLGETKCMVAR